MVLGCDGPTYVGWPHSKQRSLIVRTTQARLHLLLQRCARGARRGPSSECNARFLEGESTAGSGGRRVVVQVVVVVRGLVAVPATAEVDEGDALRPRDQGVGVEHVVAGAEGVVQDLHELLRAQPRQREEDREDQDVDLERPELVEEAGEGSAEDEHPDQEVAHELHERRPQVGLPHVELRLERRERAADDAQVARTEALDGEDVGVEALLRGPHHPRHQLLVHLPAAGPQRSHLLPRQQPKRDKVVQLQELEPGVARFVDEDVHRLQVAVDLERKHLRLLHPVLLDAPHRAADYARDGLQLALDGVAHHLEVAPAADGVPHVAKRQERGEELKRRDQRL
mmetsp:Transcript_55884/g.130988  ORF Transcript_55884/g.130988 Transcript_55884/m.130988 type:complete len:340 (-) Transcript_55884:90-1109(-)